MKKYYKAKIKTIHDMISEFGALVDIPCGFTNVMEYEVSKCKNRIVELYDLPEDYDPESLADYLMRDTEQPEIEWEISKAMIDGDAW